MRIQNSGMISWLMAVVFMTVNSLQAFPRAATGLTALAARTKTLVKTIALEHVTQLPLKRVTFEIADPGLSGAPSEIKAGANAVTCMNWSTPGNSHIIISNKIEKLSTATQSRIILHELAHIYDPYLKRIACVYCWQDLPMENGFYPSDLFFEHYPYLKDDADLCIKNMEAASKKRSQPLSYEWYADWQAIQWMKKHLPDEAVQLKKRMKQLIACGEQRSVYLHYPPFEIMLKWLEE